LITGANGFVGFRLCRHLLQSGYRVVAGVRQSADLTLLSDLDVAYRYGDVTHPETLPEMVRGLDFIVHNAGITKAKPKSRFFDVNEQGTRNLFEAILTHNPGVKRAIYISSVAAAGPSTPGRPVLESDPPRPITTYGESKLAGEKVALSFADRLQVISIRPPGVYGPGDKAIFDIFKTVHMHIKPMLGNPNRKLQLVHVDDLCHGVECGLKADASSGGAYFIADKTPYTYRDLINTVVTACGRWTVPLILPSPLFRAVATIFEFSCKAFGGTPMLTREKTNELNSSWEMDVTKAREELGFESRISFDEGSQQTYQWYLDQGWLK
jgi:nucleoside-diphosphate-sugar epimerase